MMLPDGPNLPVIMRYDVPPHVAGMETQCQLLTYTNTSAVFPRRLLRSAVAKSPKTSNYTAIASPLKSIATDVNATTVRIHPTSKQFAARALLA
jgi:hypothetical protein